MSQEIGQLDISERPLLVVSQPKASEWTEIGEATITHTIFGKAKVRIARKHDKLRRALSLLALAVIAVAAWQGWIFWQGIEQMQGADSLPHLTGAVKETIPVSPDEGLPASATAPLVSKAETGMATISKDKTPQQAHAVKNPGQEAEKQVNPQPLKAVNPQSAPLATHNNTYAKPLPVHPLPKPAAASAVHVTPAASSPVVAAPPKKVESLRSAPAAGN